MSRFIAYYRVSTQRQGQSGLGLEAQRTAVLAYVKAVPGGQVIGEYTEIESGKDDDRPELARALAHTKRLNATLVIARLDRLARKVSFVANLQDSGVEFVACDIPAANRMTIQILAAVAEDEARRISQRTKAALQVVKARGTKLGGVREGQHTLTSEDRQKGQAKAAKVRSENVRQADADVAHRAESLRSEGLSLAAIAKRLNEDGFTTRTGKPFGPVQVMRVLKRAEG